MGSRIRKSLGSEAKKTLLKNSRLFRLQDRLGQTRSDLAECAQLTQVVSERLEAVEAQLRAELAKLMVLGQQTAVRMEAKCVCHSRARSACFDRFTDAGGLHGSAGGPGVPGRGLENEGHGGDRAPECRRRLAPEL